MTVTLKTGLGRGVGCLLIAVALLVAACSSAKAPKRANYTDAELDSFMVVATQTKFLMRLALEAEEAAVNRELWDRLPKHAQEESARMLAWVLLRYSKKTDPASVTILDAESGNRLATFNETLGFKRE